MSIEKYSSDSNLRLQKQTYIPRQQTNLGEYGVGPLRDVTTQMEDMTFAARLLIHAVEEAGLTDIKDVGQIPTVMLPDDYFPTPDHTKRTSNRTVLQEMSDQGKSVALYLAQIWTECGGYYSDMMACAAYDTPAFTPGAQTFAALTNRFSYLIDQLPPADREKLYEMYLHSLQHGPQAVLDLLPQPTNK